MNLKKVGWYKINGAPLGFDAVFNKVKQLQVSKLLQHDFQGQLLKLDLKFEDLGAEIVKAFGGRTTTKARVALSQQKITEFLNSLLPIGQSSGTDAIRLGFDIQDDLYIMLKRSLGEAVPDVQRGLAELLPPAHEFTLALGRGGAQSSFTQGTSIANLLPVWGDLLRSVQNGGAMNENVGTFFTNVVADALNGFDNLGGIRA